MGQETPRAGNDDRSKPHPTGTAPARGTDKLSVLITGANRGIGLELARAYAERGWRVYATARRPHAADALRAIAATHHDLLVERLDVLDHESVDALAQRLDGVAIDVLLNNAAILGEPDEQRFGAMRFDTLERIFATNVHGPLKMSEAFVEHVARSRQKKIVAITSAQGSISMLRTASIPFYNMSKTALNMGMRFLSKALEPRGIIVVLVSPGAVDTEMMRLALKRAGANFPLLAPADSAGAVMDVIGRCRPAESGQFLSHEGQRIPW